MSRITVRTLLVIGSIAVAGGGVSQAQSSFIRGDANQSSRVNLSDALALLEHLFAGGAERLRCLDAGDANDDGRLNVTDAVFVLQHLFGDKSLTCLDRADSDDNGSLEPTDGLYLLNFLFLGGGPPPAPFRDCGIDRQLMS